MKKLSIKSRTLGRPVQYKENLESVTTFFRRSEDRIEVKNGEQVIIDIYDNGNLLFSGTKSELFEKLNHSL